MTTREIILDELSRLGSGWKNIAFSPSRETILSGVVLRNDTNDTSLAYSVVLDVDEEFASVSIRDSFEIGGNQFFLSCDLMLNDSPAGFAGRANAAFHNIDVARQGIGAWFDSSLRISKLS